MISEQLDIINNHLNIIKGDIIDKLKYYMKRLDLYGIIADNEYNFDPSWDCNTYIDMKDHIYGYVVLVQVNPYAYDENIRFQIPMYIIDFDKKEIEREFNSVMLSTLNYDGEL